jgi:hypothetical protein
VSGRSPIHELLGDRLFMIEIQFSALARPYLQRPLPNRNI